MATANLSTAAYVELALRAAESGDGAALAGAVLSIPLDELPAVNAALAAINDQSTPLGVAMLAAANGYRSGGREAAA